jgi:Domain of unknown function (DUF4386)
MFWTNTARVAGVLSLLVLVGLVLGFIFGETPSASRDDIGDDLADVADDNEFYLTGQGVQVVISVLVPILGAALYTLFRERDRFPALLGFGSFFAFGILFAVSAACFVTLEQLATDLEEGGAGGAGAAEVLETARTLTTIGDATFFLGITFFAVGLIGFGLAMAYSAEDLVPSWIGWSAVAAGVLYLLGWGFVASEWLFILVGAGFLVTLVWLAGLAYLLLFRSPAEPALGGPDTAPV